MKALLFLPLVLVVVFAPSALAELPVTDLLAGIVVQQFDRDHDGMIDINEWQNGANDGFIHMDHDQDGFISNSEIEALSDDISDEVGRIETGCAKLFKLLDTNHDGLVTKAELADLPLKLFQSASGK
jgi:Ca2+-binding EF-hand superfamily protein